MKTSRPTLHLTPDHREHLADHFEETMASLASYFALEDATPEPEDMEQARTVAAALEGVMHSSDTDCGYYPCVLTGAEPLEDSFFAALGVARDAKASVSGWENPKLEVVAAGPGKRSALALITRLNDAELGFISDYIDDSAQKALKSAIAKLDDLGPIVGVQLCTDDGASKVVLTLARRETGVHVGVLTIRVET